MSSAVSDSLASRTARRLLERGSGAHAILLFGASGSGKSALADYLAAGWVCKQPVAGLPCGECRPCAALASGNLVDVLRIAPGGRSALIQVKALVAEGGAADEGDDKSEIPALTFLRTAPLMSKRKVVVIDQAERMTEAAANALLKTLEEPGAHAKLILTTSQIGALKPTIRSRCLCIPCEQQALPDGLAGGSAILADGSSTRLQWIADNPELFQELLGFFEAALGAPTSSALGLAEQFRAISGKLESLAGGPRAGHAEALSLFGLWVRSMNPPDTALMLDIAEAHRQTLGNGNFAVITDCLFARSAGLR